MARNYTKNQLEAIESRGCDLLVSAGAGSGKTAVLTERIIRRLTSDPEADITRMLIVTFTKAAASELRERISSALSAAIASDPTNKRLSRQLFALDRAKICTIHSFCLDLLREFFTEVGLTADFRIADDTEIRLLRASLMDELIEDCYGGAYVDDFPALADSLTGTKGDGELGEIFLRLYDKFASIRESISFISDFADELERDSGADFAQSRCGEEILTLVTDTFRSYLDAFVDILPALESDDKLRKAYFPAFSYEIDFIREANRLASLRDFAALRELFASLNPPRLGVVRGELDPDVAAAKSLRDAFKKERDKLGERFFSLTPEAIRESQLETAKLLRRLHRLLEIFGERFDGEKRKRRLVDFNDLERLASRLLIGADGAPTQTARLVSERFDEIFIDEYQDVNSLQDAIFAAVSRGGNRFMVGDVKQSIYAFRGAEHDIFEGYRRRFSGENSDGRTIFLSDNFRCDAPIIDFTNLVSRVVFTNGRGGLPYYPEDDLVHSKLGDESGEPVRVVLIDGEEDEASSDVSVREAEYVADEISRLLESGTKDDGSPIRASDIAILMRSAKAQSEAFEAAFEARKIPFYNNVDGDFFENPEVLLALCLLNAIDDPTRDIYLAGALKSPIFGFTLDELTLIRRHSDGSLFDALKSYTAAHELEKGKFFLETLEKYRRKAESLPVDRLIWYLYSDTDLPALVASDDSGNLRRANLTLLYEYARRFESSSYKGLYNFIRYINDILEERATLENAKIFSEASDTVKLMTIHQSKGLEFPVVFVCGTAKKFNEADLRANIVTERSLGIAPKLPDESRFARYDTPVRQAIAKKLADSQLEEEMRVLYVALTRARERLYVTGLVKEPESLLDKCDAAAERLSRNVILQNGGYLRWILTAISAHERMKDSRPYVVEVAKSPESADISEEITSEPQKKPETSPELTNCSHELEKIVRERFTFEYPRARASKLPAKLSVSELYPSVLDEADVSTPLEPSEKPELTAKLPLFMQESTDERATSAERGTATHCFMQFCDLGRFRGVERRDLMKQIDDECARLEQEKFLSPRTVSLVNRYQLRGFFESELYRELVSATQLRREFRFNVKLPASDFTQDEDARRELDGEFILVQGVIDCFFENPDGTLTLVDYKTDFIPREMERSDAENMLRERHKLQLEYYRRALERLAAKPVSRLLVYSFGLDSVIAF